MEWQHIYASPVGRCKQNTQMCVGTLRKNIRGGLLCDFFLFSSEVDTVKAVILWHIWRTLVSFTCQVQDAGPWQMFQTGYNCWTWV